MLDKIKKFFSFYGGYIAFAFLVLYPIIILSILGNEVIDIFSIEFWLDIKTYIIFVPYIAAGIYLVINHRD